MIEINFFVPGHPVPTPRPRVTRTGVYYAQRYKDWLKTIQEIALKKGKQLLPAPIAVALLFRTPTRRRMDVDNLAKAVLDALTGIFWEDDSDVVSLCSYKRLVPPDHSPGVAVRIMHNPDGFYERPLILPKPYDIRRNGKNG